ncbi:site-specific integrase [Amycolatopsis anabasis]|uniref:site-specific integrase n=1 Tax=Amycolatopsis anabasis TaxID=1840409 RepID=UPI00131A7BC9|nr:site-specific integrase [Amycolatopsis anabasis]
MAKKASTAKPDPIKTITHKNGHQVYRFVLDLGKDPITEKRVQKTFTYDPDDGWDKNKVKDEYKRIKKEVKSPKYITPTKVTVGEWLDRCVEEDAKHVELHSQERNRNTVRPAKECYGEKPLSEFSEQDMDDLVEWMLRSGRKRGGEPGTGLSVTTVQMTIKAVRTYLRRAKNRGYLDRNVAEETKIPLWARRADAARKIEKRKEHWTTPMVRTYLNSIAGHRLEGPILLGVMGMGPAEVCGVRWDEDVRLSKHLPTCPVLDPWAVRGTVIDLEEGESCCVLNGLDREPPMINAGANTRTTVWTEHGRVVDEKPGKTEFRNRWLPLPRRADAALNRLYRRQERERQRAGSAYEYSGYILVDESGRPQETDWLRRQAQGLMIAAGVPVIEWYWARHVCLTYLEMTGVPSSIVSAWAGHALGSRVTRRHYVIPQVDHLLQGKEKLDTLLEIGSEDRL